MMVCIEAIEPYLPGVPVLVHSFDEELASAFEAGTWRSLRIDTVMTADDHSAADLALGAVRQLLRARDIDPSTIDALILLEGRAPSVLLASEATHVQREASLDRAMAFTVGGLGCVSSSMALGIARSLLLANPSWRRVMIAGGSRPAGAGRYRHPVTVIGDGGVAALVGRDRGLEIVDVEVETDGRFWNLFSIDYRGLAPELWREACKDVHAYSFTLAIESRNRFTAINKRLLMRNGLEYGDIQHAFMQNISTSAFQFYERHFGFQFAFACADNLRSYGHLGAADILLNLRTAIDDEELMPGQTALVMNNSPVAAWASLLLRA